MKLVSILLADLKRQYHHAGFQDLQPNFFDLIKHLLNPRFTPVVLCRLAHYFYIINLPLIARSISLLNFIIFGIEIAMRCDIDEGLYFPHTSGTVIGAIKIGKNAVIYQGVTIGAKEIDINYHENLRPCLGDNVTVGSGVKVLGGISIGNNVILGANAVVTKSVCSDVVAVGIPARIIRNIDREETII
jgi:serine O-acetyltransferase